MTLSAFSTRRALSFEIREIKIYNVNLNDDF